MYVIPPTSADILQGDIFKKLPIIVLPSNLDNLQFIKDVTDNPELENTQKAILHTRQTIGNVYTDGEAEIVAVNSSELNFMAISQTCDLQRKDFIVIAPIFPLIGVTNKETRNQIKAHKIIHKFYLPETNFYEESYADLSFINSIPRSLLEIDNRLCSLELQAQYFLASNLEMIFGRVVEPLPVEPGKYVTAEPGSTK